MQKHQQKVFLRDIFAPRQTSNFACPRFAKLLLVVAMMVVPWVTQGQSFNYSCNFDSDSDTAGWVFVNGSQSNQWAIGTATNNSGTKSMYVSNDNGVSNSYTNSSTTFCYAYREVTLDAGNYVLTYDWKAYGESNYDYIRVFLAPSTLSLAAGQDPSGGTSAYSWRNASLPAGCIGLHGSTWLNMQSSWQNMYVDLNVATAGTYKLVFAWANDGSGGSNPPAAIDNISLSQPTCARPTAIAYENVTAHSFDISWTEAGSATEWVVRLTAGGTVVSSGSVFDTTASFTALNDNTDYMASVASVCDVGDTSPWRSITVRTYCDPMDELPYVMTFEGVTSGTSNSRDFGVDCWWRVDDGTDYFYPYVSSSSSYNHTRGGNMGLYWYNPSSSSSYGTYDCIVMPGVDTSVYPMNTLQMSFWAKVSGSYNPVVQVGVMSDPTDINTFDLVATVNISSTPTWHDYIVRFDNYTGDGNFVAIKSTAGTYWYLYVDDFTLEVAPGCPRVENIASSAVTPNSATISWSESGTATSWEVRYLADGMPSDSAVSTTVHDSLFAHLTGLQPNTSYTVWVTPICMDDSAGSNSFVFTTLCSDFDSLPYTYGFEDVMTTNQSLDFGVGCWYRVTDASEYPYPYVAGSSYAHSGNRGLYWYTYWYSGGSYGQHQFVVLPRFDSVAYPVGTLQLRFWARSSSTSYYPTLQVGVITDMGDYTTFTPVSTVNIGNSTLWHEVDVPLTGYTGPHGHVALYVLGSSSSWTAYFDDFTLEVAPPCPRPADLHVMVSDETSITIDWTDPDTATTAWQVVAVPVGQDITSDSAFIDYPTAHPYTLTPLEPGTAYNIYVYAECPSSEYSMGRMVTANTDCTPIDTLPYRYGFEGTTADQWGTIDNCWKKFVQNEGIQYPYPSNVSFEGTRSLLFYGYQTYNVKSWATLPLFNDSIDDLQVSFKLRAYQNYSYYCADLTVGLMTNPYDLSTFTPITRCEATSTSVWDSFTVILTGHQSEGRYIAFLAQARNSTRYYDYVYLDDVVVDYAPNCGPVTDLSVQASATSAIAAWTPGVRGESQGALIEYREADDTTAAWMTDFTSSNFITITGLNPNTTYVLHVYNSCVDDNSPTYTETFFTTVGFSCVPDTSLAAADTIGNGTNTDSYLPSYATYDYSITQQIYLARELAGLGQITGMKLNTSTHQTTRQWEIYLANVSDSSVSSWIVPSQQTLVWSGTVTYVTEGWLEFDFSVPFTYTGGNLLVTVVDQTGSWSSSNSAYVHSLTGGRQSRYMYRDGSPYNIGNPSADGTGNTATVRNNMIFSGYACTSQMSSCAAPPAMVTSYNSNGATIDWAPGSGESSWELYYRNSADTAWTSVGEVYTNSYTFTTLAPGTEYQAKIVNNCTDENRFSVVNFFVPCPKIDSLPFFENFNSYGSGTGVHAPTCWTYGCDYSESYPYIYNYYNHSGSTGGCMYMYNYTYYDPDSKTYFTLPELDSTVARVNETQVVFYAMDNSAPGYLIIGVCNTPGDMNTFVPVDTVIPGYDWTLYEIPLNSYTDSGRYITFVSTTYGSTYTYNYVDDLWLERIPSCQRPDSLQAYNPTTNSVTLQWRSRSEATEFVIEYGPLGFTPGTGTAVVANTNPFVLSGLPNNYQGEYYVRNICSTSDTSDYSRSACPFTLHQVAATLPYVCTFEDTVESRSWQTSSNSDINWAVGSATVDSGNYAMYVSPDYGATYGNANFSSVVNATAYRDIDFGLIDSSYTITFRAKAGGTTTNTYDGLMVFLVDTTNPVTSSTSSITSPWGNVNDLYLVSHIRLDTSWNTYSASFDTIHGVHRVAFFWFNQNTGSSYTYLPGPAAVDNIRIDYSSCTRPVNLAATTIGSTTATLTWSGSAYMNYRVVYREVGTPASTNVYVTTSTNSVTLTGLNMTTNYEAWVQKICGTDSSLFSDATVFQTNPCDDAVVAFSYDPAWSTTTSSYAPIGYSFYNYSYVQTIIDSAQLAGLSGPITAMGYNPVNGTAGNYFTNMDVYLANVSESDLSTGFIHPDATHQFVQVSYGTNLSYSDGGWQLFALDSTFEWDGHSNLLVSVNRRHGSYTSGATFNAHNTTGVKTRYLYQDGGAYDPTTASGGTTLNLVGDMKFVSCGAIPTCPQPIITNVTYNYESATITWTGDSTAYEVNIKESAATDWPATDIAVTGNTYTFTGLQPSTSYTFRVRQDCNADTLGYSEWTIDEFTTDSLPCLAPDSLHVTAVTNTTATFDWTPLSTESAWEIHVWSSGSLNDTIAVNTHPATIGGLNAGVTYQAAIRALCGSAQNIEGDWGDTITFTTAVCPDVTGLGTRGVTANSVEVYWDPDPLAQTWIIEYGFHGFDLGTGTQVTTSLTTYTINGLLDDMEYDFRVRAVCGDDWQSEGWATTSATTLVGGVPCDPPTAVSAVVAGNAATVSWTANTGNISFVLEYGTRGFALGSGTTVNATASPVTISNLDYETAYDVYVKANCADNTSSAWSTVASFTTEAQGSEDCDPVTDLAATNVTESAALLTWTPGNSGDEWEVVLTTAAGATVSENSTTERQFQLTDLTPGTAYVAKVRTVCGDGQYSTFAIVSFTTNSVGIADVTAPACTIYPNPTSGATTVSVSGISGKVRIAVVDMNGREVTSETLDCSGDCAKTMSVDNLAQGAYFVRITGENANMVRKLIVR